MENNILFELKTAWRFPILKYTTKVTYVKARRASGIEYILLQLIRGAENNDGNLALVLKSLGVPNDIHFIFIEELNAMLSHGIIQMTGMRNLSYEVDSTYNISDFEMTEFGKKLFLEGTVPTGEKKEKLCECFYDASLKSILMKFDRKLIPLENSILGSECIGDVQLEKEDVEHFIEEKKSEYEFKKGESISEFSHQQPEVLEYKIDDIATLTICRENIQIKAKDKGQDTFIHKFYTGDSVTNIISTDKKYKFNTTIEPDVREYEYKEIPNIIKFIAPSQMHELKKTKKILGLDRRNIISRDGDIISQEESADIMEKCAIKGVACYFENGKLFSIIPGRFIFDDNGFSGNVLVNLIGIQEVETGVQQKVMTELFLKSIGSNDPLQYCDIIKKLTQISKISEYMEKFAKSLLKNMNSLISKIEIFLKLNDKFSAFSEWKKFGKIKAEELFKELCAQVTCDDFIQEDKLGKRLNAIIGLDSTNYLNKISEKLIENETEISIFEVLEKAGYKIKNILSIVNIFKVYCKKILENEMIDDANSLSEECMKFYKAFFELKEIAGISNLDNDYSEINFDADKFLVTLNKFNSSLKQLEKYKIYAMEEYNVFEAFKERYSALKDMIAIEKEAMKHPKYINKDYIEQKIENTKYKDAICDLHIRLQFELNRLFKTENMSTYELLSKQEIKKYLSEDELKEMNTLRKCRNEFQHPKREYSRNYSANSIKTWCSIVEKLGGIENESCSKN